MASRLRAVRTGIAVLGAAVTMLMTTAGPAGADPATGLPTGGIDGYHVNVGKGKLRSIITRLHGFELADQTRLDMYCVEVRTPIDYDHEMVEKPWDEFPDPKSSFHENRDQINWILHNSYPVVKPRALAKVLRDTGVTLHGGLNTKEAITGTQAAIWHYSDGVELNRKDPLPVEKKRFDADVLALYDYLTGDANVGLGDQPSPALEVSPTEMSGAVGERIGPFTVTTTGSVDELTATLPEGVRVTNLNGEELDASRIENGTELYFDVPADAAVGEGSFALTARAALDTGRLFVGKEYSKQNKTQSLIVAKSERSSITATGRATWAEGTPPTTSTPPSTSTTPPTSSEPNTSTPATATSSVAPPVPQPKNSGGLASTGASVFAPVAIGLVLIGAGAGTLLLLRRRRRA